MNDGRARIRALSARVDDAKFFRTARLDDDLLARARGGRRPLLRARTCSPSSWPSATSSRPSARGRRPRSTSRSEDAVLPRAGLCTSSKQTRQEFAIAFLEMLDRALSRHRVGPSRRGELLEKIRGTSPESRRRSHADGQDLHRHRPRLAEPQVVAGTIKGTVFTITKIAQTEVPLSDDPETAILAALPDLASELGEKVKKNAKGARFGLSGKELIIRYTQVPPVPLWRLRLLMEFEVREMAAAGRRLARERLQPRHAAERGGRRGHRARRGLQGVLPRVAVRCGEGRRSATPSRRCPASLALFNAFVGSGDIHEGEYTFLVDLGDRNVELALQKDGELIFARNIATGGRALTEAIAGALNTSVEDAEGLKHQFGSVTTRGLATYTSGREEKVGNAIIGPVGQLSAMIQSSLAFIRAQTKIRDLEVGRILLSGGGANLRGLPEYLGAAFHCPVGRFQPEAGLDLTQLPADEAALFQTDPGSFADRARPRAHERRRAGVQARPRAAAGQEEAAVRAADALHVARGRRRAGLPRA